MLTYNQMIGKIITEGAVFLTEEITAIHWDDAPAEVQKEWVGDNYHEFFIQKSVWGKMVYGILTEKRYNEIMKQNKGA